jgi:RNA polymerase sigma-70 factor (ECF subfamily)
MAISPDAALAQVMREERGRIMAALVARIGDFTVAEDALQEAAASALVHWGRGVPDRPDAWLIRAGLRKALDRLRGEGREGRKAADWARIAVAEAEMPEAEAIADERLRLIFTCCHPALEPKTRVALTLRTLCGLTTVECARLWLDAEPAMGQRLARAKAKIREARIPFAVPEPAEWPARLNAVLEVVYLVYTLGHQTGPDGRDLAGEAIRLARVICALRPGEAEAEGLLALLLLTEARRGARVRDGVMVPLAAQDRALWDRGMIEEGVAVLDRAVARGGRGPFRVKAAIAALHDSGAADPVEVAALWGALAVLEPTDVVRLNLAAALAEAGQVERALGIVGGLACEGYQPFHAVRAHLWRLAGDARAAEEYGRAAALSLDPAERAWLLARAG